MSTISDVRALKPEDLLRHDAWLRRLVATLIDERDVDDVVQQTWTAAVESPPADDRSPRGWLATVARNAARRTRRTAARRATRETRAAQGDEIPSTQETLVRLEEQRSVTRAVADLAEPYRTAILLRYFHDLDHREIATRTGVSVEAARQRTARGREMLRGRMQEKYGRDWRAIAPLVAIAAATRTTHTAKVLVLAACALVGAVATFALWPPTPAPLPTGGAGFAAGPAIAADEQGETTTTSDNTRRAVVAPARDTVPPMARIAGRVVDPRGAPVPFAEIGFQPAARSWRPQTEGARPWPREVPLGASPQLTPLGRADAQGIFELRVPGPGCLLTSGDWLTVRAWGTRGDADEKDALLVAGPAVALSGRVIDDRGQPLRGVTIKPEPAALRDLNLPAEQTMPVHYASGRFDERFALDALPGGALRLDFEKSRHLIYMHDVATTAQRDVTITLPRIMNAPKTLRGRVLDAHHAPLAGVTVGLGEHRTTTDDRGNYAIRIVGGDYLPFSASLWAVKAGLRGQTIPDFATKVLGAGAETEAPDLVLDGTPLSIRGRVVGSDGAPVAGQLVYLWDQTPCDQFDDLENLSLGTAVDAINIAGYPCRSGGRTEADGTFTIRGLLPRNYRIRVLDTELDVAMTSDPIRAGATGVELRWPGDRFRTLEGRVLTSTGRPVAGASLEFGLVIYRHGEDSTSQGERVATTDAHGRFRIERMPRYETWIDVDGEDIVQRRIETPPTLEGPLNIEVYAVARFRLEISDPELRARVDRAVVLDARGERVRLTRRTGSGSSSSTSWHVEEGRTPVLITGQNAVTLLLMADDEEVERIPLRLDGNVTTVRR